jgi:hypothetical protein
MRRQLPSRSSAYEKNGFHIYHPPWLDFSDFDHEGDAHLAYKSIDIPT